MGTPHFAVPSLQLIQEAGYEVAAVVTAPDQPQGRGQKIAFSPIKDYAQQQGIPVLQPLDLKSPTFIEALHSYHASLYVVVAFRLLPKVVWDIPHLGTINLHASCLPQYRGAAPIHWAIINGETKTGLTTFFIDEKMDTGQIILQKEVPIYVTDTTGTLSKRLENEGAQILVQTIDAIATGHCQTRQQPIMDTLKKAPKIHKQDCQINWHQTTHQIFNFIRGLSPLPGAYTMINGVSTKILMASPRISYKSLLPGEIAIKNKQEFLIGTTDGAIAVEHLQPAGKKSMDITSFLCGYQTSNSYTILPEH